MVKVIKKYFDEPKQIECNQCRDTLEYTYEDLNILFNNSITIQCPTCGLNNNLYYRTNFKFIKYLNEKLKQ